MDTGQGFNPEDLAQVTHSLTQTTDFVELRDGLGLFICKHLVALNQGSLSIISAGKNLGSTSSFSMKMTRQTDPEQVELVIRTEQPRSQNGENNSLFDRSQRDFSVI